MSEGRSLIIGSEPIAPPFPLRMQGSVQKGFGRGSKELGIPTGGLSKLRVMVSHFNTATQPTSLKRVIGRVSNCSTQPRTLASTTGGPK